MEKNSTMMKKMNVLEVIEMIVEMTNDQGITTEMKRGKQQLVTPAKPYIKELMARLGIENEMEALFLAVFIDQCNDTRINMKDIARHFDVRMVKILSMAEHIDSLVHQGIIMRKKDGDGDITYRVPNKTIECLRNGTLPEKERIDGLTPLEFYDHLDRLLVRRENDEIEDSELYQCIDELINSNPQIELTGRLRSFGLNNDNLKLYLVLCRIFIKDHDDRICRSDIRYYFENSSLRRHVADLTAGTHTLMKQKLVEHSFEDGQADTECWRLTDYSKREVLSELKLNVKKENRSNLTRHEDITPKTLYYNDNVTKQVNQLQSLLGKVRMARVQQRLKEKGMRTGFTCLFYGGPGTGKTETAQQLARLTGRDIMLVEVPNVRSKWVGETEKNIKEIFDRYKRLAKNNDIAPILLFNEADAVLNKRAEGATGSVDKMENAMQNIILQEMEQLEGIMIATTNLTGSLDSAFERRFLYKIEFEKPTPNESRHIWKSMLPELTDDEALSLAKSYDFSGGQIENIARKQLIDNVLSESDSMNIEAIHDACKSESLSKHKAQRIGF
ncbi:MAG: ATP-binding protein [Bacteroidaceae bacterium]|nr:ATP-binding protein [Bacteroidaceae bacterium]